MWEVASLLMTYFIRDSNPKKPLLGHLCGRRWGLRFQSQLAIGETPGKSLPSVSPDSLQLLGKVLGMVEEVEVWNHLIREPALIYLNAGLPLMSPS